jgi:hypothetical protein
MSITPQEALQRTVEHREIFHDEMLTLMRMIMNGEMSPLMTSAILTGLRVKKETIGEISAAAQVMREFANRVEVPALPHFVDIVGTGGDGSHTFNISTASMFVAAAAGARVAKHGNRAMSSRSGAADVLEALGVRLTGDAATLARWIDAAGPPQRRKLAILLAGLDHQDGLVTAGLRQLSTAQDDGAAAALLTARLEIDGPAGIAKVEADWAMAPGLSRTVSGSALLALRVHAEAEPELWRAPVGTAYRRIVTLNPSLAGMAASHLEALAMWDAAPALGQALADGILPDDAELPVLGFLRAGPTAAAAEAEAAIMARQQLSAGRRSSGSPE